MWNMINDDFKFVNWRKHFFIENYTKLKCDELAVSYDLVKNDALKKRNTIEIDTLIKSYYSTNRRSNIHIANESQKLQGKEVSGVTLIERDSDYNSTFNLATTLSR